LFSETGSKPTYANTMLQTSCTSAAATAEADEVEHPGTHTTCEVPDQPTALITYPMPVIT